VTDDLDDALNDLDRAAAQVHATQTRRELAQRPGLAYAVIDDTGTYLVTWNGTPIGHLHHNPDHSWLKGWTATPGETGDPLGPYLTPRQAATALLHTATEGRTPARAQQPEHDA
jgi:hypothetical protein